MELPSIGGGGEGTGGIYPEARVREVGPPVYRYLDVIIHTDLTLGTVYTMSRPTTTRPRAEQREGAAREDRVDLALQGTPRATVGSKRGVFSCGFPRLV